MTSSFTEDSLAPGQSQPNSNRPLRVLHLIEALGPGGAERLLYTNLKHLDPAQIHSSVMTVFPDATHWLEPIRKLGVTAESLNCRNSCDLPGAAKRLRSWLRRNRPDLIHSHLWAANVIARIAGPLSRVPVISSVHNPDHEMEAWEDGAGVGLNKRRAVRGLDRWTARFGCTRMIAVSEYVRESAHRNLGFPLERIELLYNPIDTDLIETPPKQTRAQLLDTLGLHPESLILLNVARLSPQKGLLYAVQALPAILKRHPSAHLVSVGATTDPDWLARLTAEAAAVGVSANLHIFGTRGDVIDFLRSCDLFVFPSLYEGLGIALIEAMGAGCACVATATGPIPEVITNGKDGILVAPADPEALADAIIDLLDDPERRAALGAAAVQTARDRFQPQASADRLAAIYESVVAERQRSR